MHCSSLIPPVVSGIEARLRAIFPYQLPRGLVDGTSVYVDEVRGTECLVQDADGRLWTVPIVALDTGCLVWQEGHWVPETDVA